jgi:hypothetical protein
VRDHGADALLAAMKQAAVGHRVKIGIMGSDAAQQHPGGLTTAEVASFHEFGIGVPQRSWLREYVDEADAKIRRRLRAIAYAVVRQRKPPLPGLQQFGITTVGEIQSRMASGPGGWKELSSATMRRKGTEDNTARLIDTGQMWSSISWLLERLAGGSR